MQVKHMTERQLLAIITNNFMGDPKCGKGFDYVDYADDIQARYWELTDKKLMQKLAEQNEGEQ